MKTRKNAIGDKNLVGQKIAQLRVAKGIKQKDFVAQIQTMGVDINPTSYSKLEGQFRLATDKELHVISQLLKVSVNDLF